MNERDDNNFEKTGEAILKSGKMAHIKLKSGRFYNGDLIYIGCDFLTIHDRYLGELTLSYNEIEVIEPFRYGGTS